MSHGDGLVHESHVFPLASACDYIIDNLFFQYMPVPFLKKGTEKLPKRESKLSQKNTLLNRACFDFAYNDYSLFLIASAIIGLFLASFLMLKSSAFLFAHSNCCIEACNSSFVFVKFLIVFSISSIALL